MLAARRRGGPAQHRLSGAPGRPRSPRSRAAPRSRTASWRWGISLRQNAIGEFGVANGSRGIVTALDVHARTLTIRSGCKDGRNVVLPRRLSGRSEPRGAQPAGGPGLCHHRPPGPGADRGRALVRLTGSEDVNWLYVQLSRARLDTRLYVVGPELHDAGEPDLPRPRPAGCLTCSWPRPWLRAGGQHPGHRYPQQPDLKRLSTAELRAERDRLCRQLTGLPATALGSWPALPPTVSKRRKPWPPTSSHRSPGRGHASLADVAARSLPRSRVAWRWPPSTPTGLMTGSGSCARTSSAARAGWRPTPTSAPSIGRWCGPWPGSAGLPAWPSSSDRPGYVPRPRVGAGVDSGRRAWRQAAGEIEQYRHTYGITDPDQPRPGAGRPSPTGRSAAGPRGH